MPSDFINIQNVSKKFPQNKITALQNISCQIPEGKITGIIGPDGAGKTTLIRCITGLLQPNEGTIHIKRPSTNSSKAPINIGYMPQKFGLYEDLSVKENLQLYATLKNIPPQKQQELYSDLLKFTNLSKFENFMTKNLSGGMQQKLGLACALISSPQLLVLDEPSVGVDPLSRQELLQIIKTLSAQGTTVLWATAYLDEAEQFDNCIVLNDGKILYQGSPHALTAQLQNRVAYFKIEKDKENSLKKIINTSPDIVDSIIQGQNIRVVFKNAIKNISDNKALKTSPRFEDAIINLLGGIQNKISPLTTSYPKITNDKEYPIEAIDITKKYGKFYAVKKNSFQIKRGEIYGLLGPNGAGKSTSFKMMCGLTPPTSGNIKIMGLDIHKKANQARSYIGYMAQKFSLYSDLNIIQNLSFFSGIYGLKGKEQKEKIQEMIELFHLQNYLTTNAGQLPLGYKQRLALSCAIIHNPTILFLDEPTSGVDPLTRREFWNHINTLSDKGVTIMVTTHFMDEAEYCNRISLFYQGETIASGTPDKLKQEISSKATLEEAFIALIKQHKEKEES